MFARRVLLAASLAAVALPLALAQPAPNRLATSWLVSAQMYLGDEGLQKELKLTDEQVKKANDLARNAISRVLERGRADEKEREKIDADVKKDLDGFLKAEQMARLRQVILQSMAGNARLGATPILNDAEAVKALKLTQEQTKKLQDRAKLADVLTDEQKKEWAKLAGKEYAGLPLRTSFAGFPTRRNLPPALHYLTAQSVRDELKLTEKQQEQVKALAKKYEKALAETDDTKKGQDLRTAGDKEGRALLEQAQAKRLAQIELRIATGGKSDAVLKHPRVVEVLKLTDDQQKKIGELAQKRRQDLFAVFAKDEDPAKVIENVQAFGKETAKQLGEILNEKQRAALKDVVGAPFTGEVPPLRNTAFALPNTPLYVYITGAAYLGSPDLHKELKVDADTARKLTAFAEKVYGANSSGRGSSDEKARKEQAEANRKELSGILDARQMRHFEALYLGYVADRQSRLGSPIHRYAEVREALKLTDEQKTKLAGGQSLEKVLDEAQAKAWKLLRGDKFEGTLTLPGRTRAAATTLYVYITGAAYLGSPDLHKELKVDADTARKLRAFADKAYRTTSGGRTTEEKARKEQAEANRKELSAILDARQMKRFEEVYLSFVANSRSGGEFFGGGIGGSTVHRYVEVQEALKLTDEQKSKLGRGGEALEKVLDEAQAKAWKQMRGDKFDGTLTAVSPFGRAQPLILAALDTPAVRDELALTKDQQTKLAEAESVYQEKAARGRTQTAEEYQKKRAEALAAVEQTVKNLLDEKQNTRLQQILLQDARKSGLRTLLGREPVKAALKFDDEQQKKLDAINEGAMQLRSMMVTEFPARQDERGAKYAEARAAITKNAEKRLEATLTAKQKDELKSLLGKPFDGEIQRPRFGGGGGFGGFGGFDG